MPAPYEVIAAPGTVYLAPVGTAFPDVDTTPVAPWVKVGTTGDRNYNEDGIKVRHSETVELWRSAGSTGARKAFRTAEALRVSLVLADLSLEEYAVALNHNTVTDTPAGAGTPGTKKVGLSRGLDVTQKALLLRINASPEGDDWNMQYEIPVAVQVAEPEVVFIKGPNPAALALEWEALEDPLAATADERFGRLVVQDDDAGT